MNEYRTVSSGVPVAQARVAGIHRVAARLALLTAALVCQAPASAQAQDIDVLIFSTEPGGGALIPAGFDVDGKIRVRDRLGFCPGGQCFFSSTDPGFRTPSGSQPAQGLHALAPGTPVTFEIVGIDAGVSIKWDASVLDAVGESTRIGSAPSVHVHPEYQLQVSSGVIGDFNLSFRLTTTSQQYEDSGVVNLTLTNGDVPATPTGIPATPSPTPEPTEPPTATATSTVPPTATESPRATATATEPPTPTATPTVTVPPHDPCDGDCDGDGVVTVAEVVRGVNLALGTVAVAECPAFDGDDDGTVSVDELIRAVLRALNGC